MSRLLLLSAALFTLTACDLMGGSESDAIDGADGDATPAPGPGSQPQPGSGDGDGDGDGGEGMSPDECEKVPEGEPLAAGQLITGKLSCGDTVVGHTKGGANVFNTKFYEKNFCTPAIRDHDSGDERIYELILPQGEANADVYLDTPCANLSLAAMKVADGIPGPDSKIQVCEMNPLKGTRSEKVHLVSQRVNRWLIVVEGEDDAEGAFQLRVECKKGLY